MPLGPAGADPRPRSPRRRCGSASNSPFVSEHGPCRAGLSQRTAAVARRETELREQLQQVRQAEQTAREREATANGQLLAAQQRHEEDAQFCAGLQRDLEKARREAEDGRVHGQAAQARIDSVAREIKEARQQARDARDEARKASSDAAERCGELKAVQLLPQGHRGETLAKPNQVAGKPSCRSTGRGLAIPVFR